MTFVVPPYASILAKCIKIYKPVRWSQFDNIRAAYSSRPIVGTGLVACAVGVRILVPGRLVIAS